MDTQVGLLLARIGALKAKVEMLEQDLASVVLATGGQVFVLKVTLDNAGQIGLTRKVAPETGSVMYTAELIR
jgi:hypothetical protein